MKRTNIDRYYGDFLQHDHLEVIQNTSHLQALSANVEDVYSTVESNSSQWGTGTGDTTGCTCSAEINSLSGSIDTLSGQTVWYANTNDQKVAEISANVDDVYSTVESNSSQWSLSANYDAEINSLSSQIDYYPHMIIMSLLIIGMI